MPPFASAGGGDRVIEVHQPLAYAGDADELSGG